MSSILGSMEWRNRCEVEFKNELQWRRNTYFNARYRNGTYVSTTFASDLSIWNLPSLKKYKNLDASKNFYISPLVEFWNYIKMTKCGFTMIRFDSQHKIYKEIFILHTPLRSLHFCISINKNAENILGLESFFIQTALLFSYIVSIKSKSNPFPIRISYIKISNKKNVEVDSTLRNHSFHNLTGRKIRRWSLVVY